MSWLLYEQLVCFLCMVQLLLIKFAKMNGGTVSKIWRPDVTHVIAAVDEDGAYVRTLKTCMAILAGRWILKIDCKLQLHFLWMCLKDLSCIFLQVF